MRIFLCGNTGSVNRGCEAIVRSTIKILNRPDRDIYLATFASDQDAKMVKELGITAVKYGYYPTRVHRFFCVGVRKIFKTSLLGYGFIEKPLFRMLGAKDQCLNVGGDTYCYGRPAISIKLNKYTHKNGISNILWCCSIEKRCLTEEIKRDLMRYEYIFARDRLTFNNLIEIGIPSDKVVKVCDPAFFLDTKEIELPDGFIEGNTVGINVSELVICPDNKIVYENVLKLIDYILNTTDMNVCLIPHVYSIKDNKNDYPILHRIYDETNNRRVSIVDKEYNCEQLKYIISKCRFFIGARTHATIAAYSSFVPTIVIGYSVKSKGIATDLFGTYDGYVLPYAEIKEQDCLKNAFVKLVENEQQIIERLKSFLPEYKKSLTDAVEKYINVKEKKTITEKEFDICNRSLCTGCSACANICPKQCVAMAADKEGFLYPKINTDKCIKCGLCEKICPIINKCNPTKHDCIVAFATMLKDTEVRLESSSGGVFTALAESIIDKGGVVFGAAFNNDFNLIHTYTETIEGLEKFRGSKYVQSQIRETYKQTKEFLDNGRVVLFTGTPCQIGGLYAYLEKDYENLITQDLICHGVPSPAVWRRYVEYREELSRASVRRMSFRRKNCGWKTFSVSFEFSNDTEYVAKLTDDPYMQAFLRNLCLRPSCYDCAFKTKHRQADLTLADFWGIEELLPEMNDDKGTSLLILHSPKSKALFNEISDKLEYVEVNLDDAVKYNPSMIKSVALPESREKFMVDIIHKQFDKTVNKFCKGSIVRRVARKVKLFIKKLSRTK